MRIKKYIHLMLLLSFVWACESGSNDESPEPSNTRIIVERNLQALMNEQATFNAILQNEEGQPIAGQTITISVFEGDAELGSGTEFITSSAGEVQIPIDLKESYQSKVSLVYAGNDSFKRTQVNVNLTAKYNYRTPEASEGVAPGSMIDAGIDETLIATLVDKMRENTTKHQYINGILIQHKGKLVLEEYFPFEELTQSDLERDNGTHYIASVSKSITSACIGIALEMGLINSLDDKMMDYFPDVDIANLDANKESITIRNLLHMQSGLNCNDTGAWFNVATDYIKYHLDLPMSTAPGTNFNYCTGVTMILGAIIEKATGKNAQDFANEHLLGKLGIAVEDSEWLKDPAGNVMCGYGLWMKARDMVKFGQLYLDNGVWDDKQVVPQSWIEESVKTGPGLTFANRSFYGFQWWVADHAVAGRTIRAYYAVGNGGNYIINIPELESVLVLYGAEWNSGTVHTTVEVELMDQLILPALLASE